MGRIGRHLSSEIKDYIDQTVETRMNFNQLAETYAPSGDDSPPVADDRVVLVQVDGTGRFVAVGTLVLSQGAKPGEKYLFSRDRDGNVQAILKLLNDGKVRLEAPGGVSLDTEKGVEVHAKEAMELSSDKKIKLAGGGADAARKGDTVEVEIPSGSVIVAVTGNASGTPNPAPIKCTGTIRAGSSNVEIG